MSATAVNTASGVYRCLCELWPSTAYAVLPEVGNATGGASKRHADAVVMSLWPSRGLTVTGVEIKVSRSDWVSELKQPEKADAIAKYVDHWYVAVSDASIVHKGELPPTWGLIACNWGKARIITPAPALSPVPLDRGFVAAMLRRAAAFTAPDAWLKEERHRIILAAEESAKATWESIVQRLKKEKDALAKEISDFESAAGINISGYHASQAGPKFRNAKRAIDDLAHSRSSVDHLVSRLKSAIALLGEVSKELPEVENP